MSDEFVFPGRSLKRPISNMTMLKYLKELTGDDSPLGPLGLVGQIFQEGRQIGTRDDCPRAILSDSQPPLPYRLVERRLAQRGKRRGLLNSEADAARQSGWKWRDNLDETGASIWMRRGGRAEG